VKALALALKVVVLIFFGFVVWVVASHVAAKELQLSGIARILTRIVTVTVKVDLSTSDEITITSGILWLYQRLNIEYIYRL